MRTYSTPQSALDGEITKLAIIECAASAALYIGLGVYFGTFKYLAVAVVTAPLMLFRTEFSADWAIQLYKKVTNRSFDLFERINNSSDKNKPNRGCLWRITCLLSSGFALVILIPLVGIAIRIIATVYWLVRRPLETLRDTPRNWLRQGLCVDFAHLPEIIPKELEAVS
jgi:hypothetical protein